MNDPELLQAFARTRSEDAFSALIDRYIRLVYSACLRQLGDRHLAEDAAQGVFVLLSQRAGNVPGDRLAGWLLTTARYACANIHRSRRRLLERERVIAMQMDQSLEEKDGELLAMLDKALGHLGAVDREALVQRYLKEQPFLDVGQVLGISEEAARKRVTRGLEKLRVYFARHGVNRDSAALSAILAEQARGTALTLQAQQAIKQGILQSIHVGASGGAAVNIARGIKMTMLTAKLKMSGLAAVIAMMLGAGGWLISQSLAEKAGTPLSGNAQVGVPAAKGTGAAVTPELVLDLSTPEKTVDSLCRALEAGDRAKLYACLTTDPNRKPTLVDADIELTLAQNRLIHAANLVFNKGPAARIMVTGDVIIRAMMTGWPAGVEVAKIDGDRAALPIVIPDLFLRMLPADATDDVRVWSGKTVPLVRRDDQWKVQMDGFVRATATLGGPKNHIADAATTLAVMMEESKIMSDIAVEVTDLKFDTWDEANQEFWRRQNAALKRAGGYDYINYSLLPAK